MVGRNAITLVVAVVAAALAAGPAVAAVRIKDITDFEGARPNQLFGMGLVVGLENTGGRGLFTQQVAVDMLQRLAQGPRIVAVATNDPVYKSGNVSVVMVTAELGPFTRKGSRIDVVVSVADDATSLQGGTLILTPLRGVDGVDYVVAQGSLSIGGFIFTAPTGGATPLASVQKNHPTVGRIPGGALVEREARGDGICHGQVRLLLKEPDYNTARCITRVLNAKFPDSAVTLDAGAVAVTVPRASCTDPVAFVADLGSLEVNPDMPARVVINERTGTIVAGEQVRISTVAVAHGNLSIVTSTDFSASQALPFAGGRTEVLPEADIRVNEQGGSLIIVPRTATVADLARALNALGATPRDLITIFQAIKQAGALHAELMII
jgi:flagellar P-ring protein precursor FlgI